MSDQSPHPVKRLYELVNPSDAITFRATPEEAAVIAVMMSDALYFVKDVETGLTPTVDDVKATRDAIFKDRAALDSYAGAFASFMVGSVTERELVEEAVKRMGAAETRAYLAAWHEKRCGSLNDICANCWDAAAKILAYQVEPETAADG